jgi:hypothetical protein
MAVSGEKYRTTRPTPVVVWRELDTLAILDDYSEMHAAVLPAGESFTVMEVVAGDRKSALCELDRERELLDLFVPRTLQNRILCIRLPTPYRIEITLDDLGGKCCRV